MVCGHCCCGVCCPAITVVVHLLKHLSLLLLQGTRPKHLTFRQAQDGALHITTSGIFGPTGSTYPIYKRKTLPEQFMFVSARVQHLSHTRFSIQPALRNVRAVVVTHALCCPHLVGPLLPAYVAQ
jgi:hypothetical protein